MFIWKIYQMPKLMKDLTCIETWFHGAYLQVKFREISSIFIFTKNLWFLGPTGFVVTGSIDGHVKFWKKREVGIEFVKHFRAHLASIRHMTMNSTGTIMITISEVRKKP